MEKPSTDCAAAVHGILHIAVEHCLQDKRLEKLNAEICRVTRRLLTVQLKEVKKTIKEYMEIQTRMIISSDPEFLSLLKVENNSKYINAFVHFTNVRINMLATCHL